MQCRHIMGAEEMPWSSTPSVSVRATAECESDSTCCYCTGSASWVTPSRTVGWAFLGTVLAPPIWVPKWPILPRCNHPCLVSCTATVIRQRTLVQYGASESYHSCMCSSFDTELLPPVEEGRVSWTGPTNKCEPKIGRA
jgi:hypothetical protein